MRSETTIAARWRRPGVSFRRTITMLLAGGLTCGAAFAAPPARQTFFNAVRAGDSSSVGTLLKAGANVQERDDLGNTPLMIAAFCADAAVLQQLLDGGAEVNATNKAGATPLMRAAAFEDKVRLLVARGADVQAGSQLGNNALILAARHPGNSRVVQFLIEQGAAVNEKNVFGATALMAAVAAEDVKTVRLLLDRGADVNAKPTMNEDGVIWGGGRTPLMWAAFRGNEALLKLLLTRGAKVNEFTVAGSALSHAAWGAHKETAKILLEAGAEVDHRDLLANFTPLHWAAAAEQLDPGLVKLLLQHRADVNAEGGQPVDGFLGATRTPLQLARKRGNTPIVETLLKAGAVDVPARNEKPVSQSARALASVINDDAIAAGIQRGLPALQKTAVESASASRRHASKQACVSCHQQELPLSAMNMARSRGLAVEKAAADKAADLTEEFATRLHELELQTVFHPEPAIGGGYALMSLHLAERPASIFTDALVHQLAVIQQVDGSWAWNLPRPPIQGSALGATALAVQALRNYPIPGRQQEFEQRIDRARKWLKKAAPESNEERAYQLLGLAWAGESSRDLRALAARLIREQRPDGGWGQLANLPSDAFATGQSVYALLQAAHLPASQDAIKNGVGFLLRSQLDDGTWHVRRRAFPFQPPMDSGFSHGADGWISAAASSWAVMALVSALDSSFTPHPQPVLAVAAPGATPAARVEKPKAHVEFARDIQPLLERSCVTCHSGERPKGGFQVINREAFLRGGKRGEPAIVAGHSEQSSLLRVVADQLEDLEMPPLGKRETFPALTKDEIARLSAWVDEGALWPEGVTLSPKKH